jgi:hypothetical protein
MEPKETLSKRINKTSAQRAEIIEQYYRSGLTCIAVAHSQGIPISMSYRKHAQAASASQLSDLWESGSLEIDPDTVFFRANEQDAIAPGLWMLADSPGRLGHRPAGGPWRRR